VVCIASADPAVLSWVQDQGLSFEQVHLDAQVPRFEGEDFDVLFSIGWLHRLPPTLLARARRIALNFHDGPLPRHGGLNAPAWALLEGCRHHGVTWHEMTPALDAGRIACELSFDLSPDETAFSLNTHCYEAGFRSFLTLVDLLATDAEVWLACDALGSRSADDRALAIQRLALAGAVPSSTESILFELLGDAKHPNFKEIQGLIK
jgi:folate-dependent phosphoribosylglycinamide formyltransferase PurN